MNKFIQYLKEKGYKIYGNKAVLLETEFNICEGYKTTAMGKQKSYWLELELMSKEYYTIIRKYYGLPDYLNTDLSKKEDCFAFDTEYEAKQCLRDIFENGEWVEDIRHGKVRHYVERKI